VVEVRLFVKVCGVTRPEDVITAARAGADAFGIVVGFPNSPRNLPVAAARDLVRKAPEDISPILVLNGSDLRFAEEACSIIEPYGVQLYGTNDPDPVRAIGVKMVIRPVTPDELSVPDGFDAVLLDQSRGTGRALDVEVCARYVRSSRLPVIVAGGLNPTNVADVVRRMRPFGVDASSGLESSPGVKDPLKVTEFVRRAREAHEG